MKMKKTVLREVQIIVDVDTPDIFGKRLKLWMVMHNVKAKDWYEETGYSYNQVIKILAGKAEPRVGFVQKVAELTKEDFIWVLMGERS